MGVRRKRKDRILAGQQQSRIENGHLKLPSGPGCGTDINEETVRAHPPK